MRDVAYGWQHHAPLGLATGLTTEQLSLIREGRAPRDLDPPELALCEFAFEIAAWRRPPPRIEEAVHAFFTPRQIVDFALLTSYYMAVAAMAIALDVSLEEPEVLLREQAWQTQYGGETG
jgi:alkylhydroperoxidase family enzyme